MRHVIALDLSAAQLEEAARREMEGCKARDGRTRIEWRHVNMINKGLAAEVLIASGVNAGIE